MARLQVIVSITRVFFFLIYVDKLCQIEKIFGKGHAIVKVMGVHFSFEIKCF